VTWMSAHRHRARMVEHAHSPWQVALDVTAHAASQGHCVRLISTSAPHRRARTEESASTDPDISHASVPLGSLERSARRTLTSVCHHPVQTVGRVRSLSVHSRACVHQGSQDVDASLISMSVPRHRAGMAASAQISREHFRVPAQGDMKVHFARLTSMSAHRLRVPTADHALTVSHRLCACVRLDLQVSDARRMSTSASHPLA
jgi:hypothetical protein